MTRLYLVDDHPIVRAGLRTLLQAWGHHVEGESADPTEAMADIVRLQTEVLLLDLNLGERSGFELLSDLQRRHLSTRCVVLTMSAQPHQFSEALRLGAYGYVLKGSSGAELASAIDAASQGRHFLGSGVAELAARSLQSSEATDPLAALSPREREIIALVAQGHSSAYIGEQLHISPKTVATYRCRLMSKLGVNNATSLVRLAIQHKLVDTDSLPS